MNCVRFEMRLDELLDERLPADSDAELNEHVETCRHCARLLADQQALLEAIDVLGRSDMRGDLATRILSEVAKKPVFVEPVLMATALSPAAVVTRRRGSCTANATHHGLDRGDGRRGALVAVGVREWNAVRHAAAIAESKTPKLDQPSSVFEKPAASEMADSRDLRAERSVAAVFLFANRISPQQRTLMEQMSVGLKPVTHSMSAALNALRRTLPGSETPARSS